MTVSSTASLVPTLRKPRFTPGGHEKVSHWFSTIFSPPSSLSENSSWPSSTVKVSKVFTCACRHGPWPGGMIEMNMVRPAAL